MNTTKAVTPAINKTTILTFHFDLTKLAGLIYRLDPIRRGYPLNLVV